MIITSNINEARRQIQKLKIEGKEVIVIAKDNNFNRKIFENKDVDMVIDLEFDRNDKLKQRDSGLNEVLCKLAKENNIKIGIDVKRIAGLEKKEKAKVLSRVKQNIDLCKRIGCKLILIDTNSKQDIISFFLSLKGSSKQAKFAFK